MIKVLWENVKLNRNLSVSKFMEKNCFRAIEMLTKKFLKTHSSIKKCIGKSKF